MKGQYTVRLGTTVGAKTETPTWTRSRTEVTGRKRKLKMDLGRVTPWKRPGWKKFRGRREWRYPVKKQTLIECKSAKVRQI